VTAAVAAKAMKAEDKAQTLHTDAHWIHTYQRQITALDDQLCTSKARHDPKVLQRLTHDKINRSGKCLPRGTGPTIKSSGCAERPLGWQPVSRTSLSCRLTCRAYTGRIFAWRSLTATTCSWLRTAPRQARARQCCKARRTIRPACVWERSMYGFGLRCVSPSAPGCFTTPSQALVAQTAFSA
jgi:hypothetical protein